MPVRAPSPHRLRRFVATAAALGSLFAGLTACDPEVPSLPPLAWQGPELSAGNTGDEVTQMQVQLRTRGFWLNDAYGTFGETTRHALVAFQKYFGLPRTGRLDERSRFILAAQSAKVEPRKPGAGRRVEVDIARQVLLISQDGVTVWVHDVSTGKSSTPTPRGSYKIQRQINGKRISALGQLWRPKYFTGGYALHGSPSVPNYPASHGCVRLTNASINMIWDEDLVPIGTPVVLF